MEKRLFPLFVDKDYWYISLNLPHLRKDITSIIDNAVKDFNQIERILDQLLRYISYGRGTQEFQKLNDYYNWFFPSRAEEYQEKYEEATRL